MAQQQMAKADERGLGELFSDLAGETGTLIRQEVALAQVEMTAAATRAGKGVGFLAVGGAVAYLAAMTMTAAVVLLLTNFVPAWAAAPIVGGVIGAASYFLISSALSRLKNLNPVPNQAIESIKEDAQWLKNEVM